MSKWVIEEDLWDGTRWHYYTLAPDNTEVTVSHRYGDDYWTWQIVFFNPICDGIISDYADTWQAARTAAIEALAS